MFGVEYLENPWREKFDFFSKKSSVSIFWRVEKRVSWLESVWSKKIVKDPCRESTEVTPMKILLCIAISSTSWIYCYSWQFKLNNWWPWSGLSGSLKVKLIALSDSRSIGYYYKSTSVTISHRKPVFSADDLDLTVQGHQRSNWSRHSNRDLWLPISVV